MCPSSASAFPGAVDFLPYLLCVPLYVAIGFFQMRLGAEPCRSAWVIADPGGRGLVARSSSRSSSTARTPGTAGVSALTQLAAGVHRVGRRHPDERAGAAGCCSASPWAAVVALTAFQCCLPGRAVLHSDRPRHAGLDPRDHRRLLDLGGVPRAARRIASIGRAHRAERQGQRDRGPAPPGRATAARHGARHALTLLAHSRRRSRTRRACGQQAADDARLLRQLRLGATPTPAAVGQLQPRAGRGDRARHDPRVGEDSASARMGLEVGLARHGPGAAAQRRARRLPARPRRVPRERAASTPASPRRT